MRVVGACSCRRQTARPHPSFTSVQHTPTPTRIFHKGIRQATPPVFECSARSALLSYTSARAYTTATITMSKQRPQEWVPASQMPGGQYAHHTSADLMVDWGVKKERQCAR